MIDGGSGNLILYRGGEGMSKEEMQTCARAECDVEFVKTKHNQKYHDNECCRLATNAKMKENYYERRDRRLGKPRTCKSCHVTQLSRYNSDNTCAGCQSQNELDTNNSVIDMLFRATA